MSDTTVADLIFEIGRLLLENSTRIAGLFMILVGYILLPKSNIRFMRIKLRKMFR